MAENLLMVENLQTFFYTSKGVVKAVDRVNLRVGEKESVGLVGESGCGKSTTGFSIMRLVPVPGRIVGGSILFHDRNLLGLTEKEMGKVRGAEISMVFQDPMSYLHACMLLT